MKIGTMNRILLLPGMIALCLSGCASGNVSKVDSFQNYTLDYDSRPDSKLQKQLEELDERLRARFGMKAEETAVGVLDLNRLRLAMVRPDHMEYAASVAKV